MRGTLRCCCLIGLTVSNYFCSSPCHHVRDSKHTYISLLDLPPSNLPPLILKIPPLHRICLGSHLAGCMRADSTRRPRRAPVARAELISDAESDGVSFCTPESTDETCERRVQEGFIRAAAIEKSAGGTYIQVRLLFCVLVCGSSSLEKPWVCIHGRDPVCWQSCMIVTLHFQRGLARARSCHGACAKRGSREWNACRDRSADVLCK